jgi:FtsP/CotA-like multicopper oxidase with cupredoxin domain
MQRFNFLFSSLLLFILTGCTGIASAPDVTSGLAQSTTMPTSSQSQLEVTPTPGSMTYTNPEAAHMMEPINSSNILPASAEIGGQTLAYRIENGVKVFELNTMIVEWKILDEVTVHAMTYNGTVPGPLIRVTEGDQVRIVVNNLMDTPTTVHWHGVDVPNAMDGVPGVTQEPILPGESFTYEFTARPAGTFMYHSHYEGDIQVSAGLYAPMIIDPKEPTSKPDHDVTLMISEWLVRDGQTYAAMPMAGMEPNYFTINGKAFPSTETIVIKKGQRLRLRFIGIGQFIHPMHLHGVPFKIVATDGHPVPDGAQLTKDTISIAPGERYDVEVTPTETGMWMLHCHILHHTTNDNVEPGGLMLMIQVVD